MVETIYIVAAYASRLLITSGIFGLLFAAIHLVSYLHNPSPTTVVMVLVAAMTGAVVPYLVLHMKNGVVYSFGLHWLFYVLLATHFIVMA